MNPHDALKKSSKEIRNWPLHQQITHPLPTSLRAINATSTVEGTVSQSESHLTLLQPLPNAAETNPATPNSVGIDLHTTSHAEPNAVTLLNRLVAMLVGLFMFSLVFVF